MWYGLLTIAAFTLSATAQMFPPPFGPMFFPPPMMGGLGMMGMWPLGPPPSMMFGPGMGPFGYPPPYPMMGMGAPPLNNTMTGKDAPPPPNLVTGMRGPGLMTMGLPWLQMMRMGGSAMPGLVPGGQGKPGNKDFSSNVPK